MLKQKFTFQLLEKGTTEASMHWNKCEKIRFCLFHSAFPLNWFMGSLLPITEDSLLSHIRTTP